MSRIYHRYLESEDPVLGTVRLCRGCGEEWPRDEEFWYFDRRGKVMGRCRACWSERNRDQHRARKFGPMVQA